VLKSPLPREKNEFAERRARMKSVRNAGLVALLVFILVGASPAQNQKKVDYGPLVGTWALEVAVEDGFFYLTLELSLTDGNLGGTLSEQNGIFSNAPLLNIEYNGEALKFDVKVPTPPDGLERLVKADIKLSPGKLEGMLVVPDLGVSVPVKGVKK
jgi:hypothetical protein